VRATARTWIRRATWACIKGVPSFKSFAPGLAMGGCARADRRTWPDALPHDEGLERWAQLQDQKDSNGRFTGKKEAYGDQFVFLHTPAPAEGGHDERRAVFSGAARVDR
jgi:hypothetical protein